MDNELIEILDRKRAQKMSGDEGKRRFWDMAGEQAGAITLPRWFLWMVGVIGVPILLGAVPWAYTVQSTLTRIDVTLTYMRDNDREVNARLDSLEKAQDDHLRDPSIHRYELERIRAELTRLSDRVDRIENGSE